jgi:hypothetical protein
MNPDQLFALYYQGRAAQQLRQAAGYLDTPSRDADVPVRRRARPCPPASPGRVPRIRLSRPAPCAC